MSPNNTEETLFACERMIRLSKIHNQHTRHDDEPTMCDVCKRQDTSRAREQRASNNGTSTPPNTKPDTRERLTYFGFGLLRRYLPHASASSSAACCVVLCSCVVCAPVAACFGFELFLKLSSFTNTQTCGVDDSVVPSGSGEKIRENGQ